MAFVPVLGWALMAVAFAGAAYNLGAGWALARLMRRPRLSAPEPVPAVTILKPLHGAETGLEQALASFLAQDYRGPIQIVFGVRESSDPAVGIVEALQQRFPEHDIALVVDPRLHGPNRKISNLANMMGRAKHDLIVLADSDIVVAPNYLAVIAASVCAGGTGGVSCLYSGEALGNVWSRLAAMGISYHFLPNAAVGIASGLAKPCFGSTIALRRDILAELGGFAAFADFLADDYEIGRALRERGHGLAYPPLIVAHGCDEAGFGALVAHELRWARTIRIVDPAGHWGSFVTHSLPFGTAGTALLGFSPVAGVFLFGVLGARFALKTRVDRIVGASTGPAWLLPLRDVLSFGIYGASLFGGAVEWRGQRLRVKKTGMMSQH